MQTIGEVAALDQQLTKAIAAHVKWKIRLDLAITTGTSEFDPGAVRLDDKCEFGSWLCNSISPSARGSARFPAVKQLHAQFHTEAARVLTLALNGRTSDAHEAMSRSSDYARISSQLISEMVRWKKEAA